MSLLAGKNGIVFGVANRRSIAWAIAQAWAAAGARLAFTYQGERLKENVEDLAATFGSDTLILPCDVTKDDEIAGIFRTVGEKFGRLDLLLHSVAFAPKDALEGEFVEHEPRGLPHRARRERLLAGRAGARGGAVDDRGRQHRGDELLRRGEGGAALQYHGGGQGLAGGQHPLPGLRFGPEENPGQLHQRGAGEHPGRARHRRIQRDAAPLRGPRAAQAQCAARGAGGDRAVPGLRWSRRHHRPGDLRRSAGIRSWGCDRPRRHSMDLDSSWMRFQTFEVGEVRPFTAAKMRRASVGLSRAISTQ